jgi:hypothetical protein
MLFVMATATVGLGLAACSGDGGGDGGDGSTVSAGGARANDGPVDLDGLTDVCAGEARLTRAAPYAGPAPHPVTVFGPSSGNAPGASPYQVKLVDAVAHQFRDSFNARPSQAQLVGCLERVRETPTDVVCRYIIEDRVPFHRASYRLTVRAVGTGAVVDRVMIEPGAGGCPSGVTVNRLGPKVWSAPTPDQYVQALQRYTEWDGRGGPPAVAPAASPGAAGAPGKAGAATPRNAGGRELTAGSARLTAPAGADAATLAVLADYLAFWAAFEDAREQGRPVTAGLEATTEPNFQISLSTTVLGDRRTSRGPVRLTPTIRAGAAGPATAGPATAGPASGGSASAGSVIIDDCLDETGREYLENGKPTGEVGIRSAVSLSMIARDGHFVATGFADAPADLCPAEPAD